MPRKLSIITICYNEPDAIKTCESIVNQSWHDFQWIVIDGGSNKEIIDIFHKFKDRIDVFVSEKDNGIYNAMNKGLSFANGEYINLLNAGDCYYNTHVLSDIFEKLKFDDDILYGCTYFSNKTNPEKNFISKNPKQITKEFFILSNIQTPSIFVKKFWFDKYGNFDENYKISSDRELWLRFIQNGANFVYTPMIVSVFDTGGISSAINNQKLLNDEVEQILNKYFPIEYINNIRIEFHKYLKFFKQKDY